MSDREKSKEQLLAELQELRQELEQFRTTKIAFEAQDELIRALVSMGQAATGRLMLRSMLIQIVQIASRITLADEGSFFLLDGEGKVVESILARGATIREQKKNILGQVLDQGLAGWVYQHQQVGLITDTQHDDRWLTLSHQPYQVGSALCIPLLRGKTILGILTLTHSNPFHFTPEFVQIMEISATQMALALDNARLYTLERQKSESLSPSESYSGENNQTLSQLGLYIITEDKKFLYANPQVAQMFGYSFGELVSLKSSLELIVPEQQTTMAAQMDQCIQNQQPNISETFQGQCKDGSSISVQMQGNRTKFYGKSVVIGVFRRTS